jgi:hypothetical protein
MAKTTITVEDTVDGGVKVLMDPPASEIIKGVKEKRFTEGSYDYVAAIIITCLKLNEKQKEENEDFPVAESTPSV